MGAGLVGMTFGCAKLIASFPESVPSNLVFVTHPFDGFSLSAADVFSSSTTSTGASLYSPRYTMTGNGDVYGTIDFTAGVTTYQRPDVAGPCTNGALTAPSCGFTWGSGTDGVYHGGDYNFFPDAPALSNEFQLLKFVQVDIHHELSTGDLTGGISDCGIDLAFGTSAGSANAALTSNNFRLPGRASTNQDIVKLGHRYNDATETILVEAPLNGATDSSYTIWGLASWAGTMSSASRPAVSGDYVDFRMSIVFDHVAKTSTITLKPLATNKTLSAMQTQTVTWTYNNDQSATENGEARGGLMFGSGTHPLAIEDLESSRASVGFFANGVARRCGFSNLQIVLLKEAETVSTPFEGP